MGKLSKQEINEIYIARKTKLYDDGYAYAKNLIETEDNRKRVFFEIETRKHHFYFLNGMRKAHSDEGRLVQVESHFDEGYLAAKKITELFPEDVIPETSKIREVLLNMYRGKHHLEWICGAEYAIKELTGKEVELI